MRHLKGVLVVLRIININEKHYKANIWFYTNQNTHTQKQFNDKTFPRNGRGNRICCQKHSDVRTVPVTHNIDDFLQSQHQIMTVNEHFDIPYKVFTTD